MLTISNCFLPYDVLMNAMRLSLNYTFIIREKIYIFLYTHSSPGPAESWCFSASTRRVAKKATSAEIEKINVYFPS